MTRINERCERFVRLRRLFIFSKATIINIFDPASKWNNTSKIYIYRVPSKYFFRWSIYFRSPFSSSAFICHSLPPRRFFPRLSCRHLHLYRDCYPFFSSIFRKLRICIISQHRKVSVIREWNTKRIGGDWMNFFLVSTNVIFTPSRVRLQCFPGIYYYRKFLPNNFKLLIFD